MSDLRRISRRNAEDTLLSCEQVLAELSNYLDDSVAADARRELESHLAECRTCHTLYDSTRKTLRIVTDTRSFELPRLLADGIIQRIRNSARTGEV